MAKLHLELKGLGRIFGISMLLAAIALTMMVIKPTFVDEHNLSNLLRWTGMFGILSLGAAFVIITGGIDLSIGSVVALSGIVLMSLLQVTYYDSGHTVTLEEGFNADNPYHINIAGDLPPFTDLDQLAIAQWKPKKDRDGQAVVDEQGQVVLERKPDLLLMIDGPATEELGRPGTLVVQNLAVGIEQGDQAVLLYQDYMPPAAAIGITLLVGVGVGLLHGLLIGYANLQPFVVTLCGLMAYRGLARLISGDNTLSTGVHHGDLTYLAKGEPFQVPVPFINYINEGGWSTTATVDGASASLQLWSWVPLPMPILILGVLGVLGAVFLHKTVAGRYLLAMGRNEEAARFSGINTRHMTVLAYVLCSGLASLGGVLLALDVNTVQPSVHGNFYELYAIAAAVLGGCSLRGGVGSIAGVIIGTAVMRSLYNAIELLEKKEYWMYIIIGAVLLMGVMMDELGRKAINSYKTRQRRKQLTG